jgi:hypothetical protein
VSELFGLPRVAPCRFVPAHQVSFELPTLISTAFSVSASLFVSIRVGQSAAEARLSTALLASVWGPRQPMLDKPRSAAVTNTA